jgi:hypothetical protein
VMLRYWDQKHVAASRERARQQDVDLL